MWSSLDWQAWMTLGVIIIMIIALVREIAPPDLTMLGSLGLLLLFGIIQPEAAFAGLANNAVLTVAALFVVAAGVQNTGALGFIDQFLFPRSVGLSGVLTRLMVTTAAMSAFLNNTPIVAMLIPRVQAWSQKRGIPTSKLLIPLSYSAIVGGMTTLIGTSTNLLVSGLMEGAGYEGLGLFDLAWAGLPAAICALLYLNLVGYRLLPDRSHGHVTFSGEELGKYLFEVRLTKDSPLVGQSIEKAGLRALGEIFLVHIRRQGEMMPSSPDTLLAEGDQLAFLGNAAMLDSLLERPGIEGVVESVASQEKVTLPLFEAVVAPSSRLVGRTLRDTDFRDYYQGVVLGIQRRDTQIEGPLGQIPIQAGDLLLIEARNGFDKRWNQRRSDFYLVAPRRPQIIQPQKNKAPLALLILLAVVVTAAIGLAPIVVTSFVGALAMIATGCLRGQAARRAIDFPVLIVIAAALGIGQAIESTGLAAAIAGTIIGAASGLGVIGVIAAVYIATSILTEFVTNNAAAALMLAIGLAAAGDLGVNPEAFAVAIAIAASASFLTPIGYQTNLMVMAAGGYRFSDYFKAGILVNPIVATVAITMIWLFWL